MKLFFRALGGILFVSLAVSAAFDDLSFMRHFYVTMCLWSAMLIAATIPEAVNKYKSKTND